MLMIRCGLTDLLPASPRFLRVAPFAISRRFIAHSSRETSCPKNSERQPQLDKQEPSDKRCTESSQEPQPQSSSDSNSKSTKPAGPSLNVFAWYEQNATTPKQIALRDELRRGGSIKQMREMAATKGRGVFGEGSAFYLIPQREAQRFPAISGTLLSSKAPVVVPEYFLRAESELLGSESDTSEDLIGATDPSSSGDRSTFGPDAVLVICTMKRAALSNLVRQWKEAFRAVSEEAPAGTQLRVGELIIVDDPLYRATGFVWEWLVRRDLADMPDDQQFVVHHYGSAARTVETAAIRDALGLNNTWAGTALLLDRSGNVRWRASGLPESDELKALKDAVLTIVRE